MISKVKFDWASTYPSSHESVCCAPPFLTVPLCALLVSLCPLASAIGAAFSSLNLQTPSILKGFVGASLGLATSHRSDPPKVGPFYPYHCYSLLKSPPWRLTKFAIISKFVGGEKLSEIKAFLCN